MLGGRATLLEAVLEAAGESLHVPVEFGINIRRSGKEISKQGSTTPANTQCAGIQVQALFLLPSWNETMHDENKIAIVGQWINGIMPVETRQGKTVRTSCGQCPECGGASPCRTS